MSRVANKTSDAQTPNGKDLWDKADIVGKLLGAIMIPVGLAVAGFFVNSALQNREAQQKTQEIAIKILQSNNSNTPELRKWAYAVFQDMVGTADQKLSPAATKELDTTPLPGGANTSGADLVGQLEGVYLKPYQGPSGIWTIGYGHTGPDVGPDTPPITLDQAKQLLVKDVQPINSAIDQLVTVPLSQNQRDALVAFVYNIGIGNFANSSVLKLINLKQYDDVPNEMRKWVGNPPIPGLVAAREKEIATWNKK